MDEDLALVAFGALSQDTRLRIVRLLVTAEPDGLPAGAIGAAMGGATSSRMSFHLGHLEQSGLVASRREGRRIIYRARLETLSGLVNFLMSDCCQGHPGVCAPVALALTGSCAPRKDPPMPEQPFDVVIYHNPDCGTSRNALGLIREAGIEPHVIEYLKTPPSREMLTSLLARMGIPARALLREKGTPYADLGLDDPALTDDQLLDAMVAHPILMNRPVVVTPLGARLCRPSETVLELLPRRDAATTRDGK